MILSILADLANFTIIRVSGRLDALEDVKVDPRSARSWRGDLLGVIFDLGGWVEIVGVGDSMMVLLAILGAGVA